MCRPALAKPPVFPAKSESFRIDIILKRGYTPCPAGFSALPGGGAKPPAPQIRSAGPRPAKPKAQPGRAAFTGLPFPRRIRTVSIRTDKGVISTHRFRRFLRVLFLSVCTVLTAVSFAMGAPRAKSLTTVFAANNEYAGNMFNVTVLSATDVVVDSFDISLGTGYAPRARFPFTTGWAATMAIRPMLARGRLLARL
jgi:hypothetical protein